MEETALPATGGGRRPEHPVEIGFVGLGKMGRPMSERLLAAGCSLHVHNRSRGAVAEAAVFGAALGADPQILLELLGTSFGGSTMMTRNMPRFISRDFKAATPVKLLLKDLGLIHDEAKGVNVPLLLGSVAEQRFLETVGRGHGDEDIAALVRLWEEAAGTTVGRS